MTDLAETALLPAGLSDGLPPRASFEARISEDLLASFAGRGYERVKPPLLEFEESLFSGSGRATASHAFRLMDPVSQRMMALRPDITVQISRIATTRLGRAPRPLRLSYAGQILRVRGSQLRTERQFGQAGIELIGAPEPAGDIEVIVAGAEALEAAGIEKLVIDLGLPTLVPALLAPQNPDAETLSSLREALDGKNAAAVSALSDRLGGKTVEILLAMLAAAGPAATALERLRALDLPTEAKTELDVLAEVAKGVKAQAPQVALTIDPVENRGFEYHTGVTVTFFTRDVKGELGRGGRYEAGAPDRAEAATGLTLFMDTVLRALPSPRPDRRVFLPAETPLEAGRALRGEGWSTIAGFDSTVDAEAEANRMHCTHLFKDGKVINLISGNED